MIASKKRSTDDLIPWDGSSITPFISYEEVEPGIYLIDISPSERFRIERFTSYIPLIIDEFKPLFGLPKIGRHRVEYLDGTVLLMVRELGSEYLIEETSGVVDHDIFKTRLFRWIFGLSTLMFRKDMIIRKHHGVTEIISKNDEKLDFTRNDPPFMKDFKVEFIMGEILYGHTLSSLRAKLNEIIRRIDPSLIWVTGEVISRLSLYGFLTDDQE